MGSQLDLDPVLVFVAVLAGAELLGITGAVLAIPAAAAVQVVAEEVLVSWYRQRLERLAPDS